MDPVPMVEGSLALLTLLTGVLTLDEGKRILQGHCEFLRARIKDIENGVVRASASSSVRAQRTRKRKRDDEVCIWVTEGRELLMVAENLLTQIEQHSRSFLPAGAKYRMAVDKMVSTLAVHDRKGGMLSTQALSDERGPHHGNHIPVKELMGRGALDSLKKLQLLLQDAMVRRIAIRGIEGIGKTFLMKHLHNCGLKWFDYVFWVTVPGQFSLELVQEAVAVAVKCDFGAEDDLNVRATKLSKKLGELDGSFVLFLDGVPNDAEFSLDQIGILIPTEGRSKCKLVLTSTSSKTTAVCRMLHGFVTVELGCLSESEAFDLLIHEAKIDTKGVTVLGDIPRLVAKKCHGVPRSIVNVASYICGVDNLHEWRNLLFELESFEKKTKLHIGSYLMN